MFQDKNGGKPIGGKISKKDLVKGKPAGGIGEGKKPIRKEGGYEKKGSKKKKKGRTKKEKRDEWRDFSYLRIPSPGKVSNDCCQ